jgi:cytidylate kinase
VPLDDEAWVREVVEGARIDLDGGHVTVDGVDVTREIRTPAIDRAAASVARLPAVRAALVSRQRDLGAGGGIVMEGRDIGTVVFPNADVKIYLDASAEERARRRVTDAAHSGVPAAVSEVVTLLTERDHLDSTRAASPLYAAPDAIVVDTTGRSIPDVVADVMAVIGRKLEE